MPDYPSEFIQTGISAIDGMNTMVRGQKRPSFPPPAFPIPGWRPKSPARPGAGDGGRFAVVFAAIGITFEEADYFINDLSGPGR